MLQAQTHAVSNPPADRSGALTQKAAVDLYGRYRKALVDGDYNTFLDCIYAPGKPADLPRVPQDQVPKEFTMMKGFILESSPDLSAAKILRFAADDQAAILVTRVDLQNKDYVTLRAIMFAADRGSWKVLTNVQDDTFPRKSAEEDEKAIQAELKHNANLQLAAAAAAAESIKAKSAAGAKKAPKAETKVQRPPEKSAVSGAKKQGPALSSAFNDSPQHKAIVKVLREKGKKQMLQTASAVAVVQGKDFANANIAYTRDDKPANADLYLFKEGDAWVAYLELPTKKDHSAIFSTLARRYCLTLYKRVDSVSLVDDTWKSKDPRKRDVNLVCSELVNNQWKDHRLTLAYEYDNNKGWHVTGQAKHQQASPKAAQKKPAPAPPTEQAKPKPKEKVVWGNAKSAIDQIFKFIGGTPRPVYIVFGSAGGDFIQFHYVAQSGSKDIQTVDWLNGKLRGPQVSRLARPCPPIPVNEIDFGQVSRIFDDMGKRAKPGDMINVNLSRRSSKGCQEPIWQGVATSSKHSLTVTYSMDGKQTDIQDYSF